MCSMKRVRLAVLFLSVAALVAGTPALAGGGGSCRLTCVVDKNDADYGASGVAKLGNRTFLYWDPYYGGARVYTADLSVACCGLTEGRTYRVFADCWPVLDQCVGEFSPDALGNGSVVGGIVVYKTSTYKWGAVWVGVYRDDGTLVLTGVL